jgi:Icc-related predicted phosphoesterase/uncharacterized protein YprB with RNaseH-like and TPR domain
MTSVAAHRLFGSDTALGTGEASRDALRIFFFSDWRIQPIEWVEAMLADAEPIDLIVYGGDDLDRFRPPYAPPDDVRAALTAFTTTAFRARVRRKAATPDEVSALMRRRYGFLHGRDETKPPWKALAATADELPWSRWEGDPGELLDAAVRVSGRRPPQDLRPSELPRRVEDALGLLYSDYEDTRFEKLARHARCGVVAIAGNDSLPIHKRVLRSTHVTDLHERPVNVDGWGFVGIEGGITSGRPHDDPAARNAIGFILHAEKTVARHVTGQIDSLGVASERLVIVTHTPPRGVLDTALRFGVNRIGSPYLRRFVRRSQPALVLTGHCHSSGRRSQYVGQTLVINGASDDGKPKQCAAAIIELIVGKAPALSWITPVRHSILFVPGIGPKRSQRLKEGGITTLDQFLDAPPEALKGIGMSYRRVQGLREALFTAKPAWIRNKQVYLPQPALFYDVETGLTGGGSRLGPEPQQPWMIGAMVEEGDRVKQWVALDPKDRVARRQMYKDFVEFIEGHRDHTLCSWSGTRFDFNAVWNGLYRYLPGRLTWWEHRTQVDVLGSGIRRRVAFPCHNWSLKTIATAIGFAGFDDLEMDGFEVGLRYELYLALGERLPLKRIRKYNATDIHALATFVEWFRANQPEATSTQPMGMSGWEPPDERLTALLVGDDTDAIARQSAHLSRSYTVFAGRPDETLSRLSHSPDVVFVCGVQSEARLRAVIDLLLSSPMTSTAAVVVLEGPRLSDVAATAGQIVWRD